MRCIHPLLLGIGAGLVLMGSAAAQAEGLDGMTPTSCELFEEGMECDSGGECSEVTPEQIGLPGLVQIDFAGGLLSTEDGLRASPIAGVEKLDELLVLHGHQETRGWTMVIERSTGRLVATIIDAGGHIVLVGACDAS
jgi:hypothetical protein